MLENLQKLAQHHWIKPHLPGDQKMVSWFLLFNNTVDPRYLNFGYLE